MSDMQRWQPSGSAPEIYADYLVPAIFGPWVNAVKVGPDCEDVDLRRLGVELDSVGWSFDAVAVRPVSFDDPGTCPVPSWSEAFFGDLVDGFGERVGESVRGKSPPGWEFGADCAVASHEGEVVGVGADGIGGVFHDVPYRVMHQQQ